MQPKKLLPLKKFLSGILAFGLILGLLAVPGRTGLSAPQEMNAFILQGQNVDRLIQVVEANGGRVTSRLDVIHGIGAELPPGAAARLEQDPAVRAMVPIAQ